MSILFLLKKLYCDISTLLFLENCLILSKNSVLDITLLALEKLKDIVVLFNNISSTLLLLICKNKNILNNILKIITAMDNFFSIVFTPFTHG